MRQVCWKVHKVSPHAGWVCVCVCVTHAASPDTRADVEACTGDDATQVPCTVAAHTHTHTHTHISTLALNTNEHSKCRARA